MTTDRAHRWLSQGVEVLVQEIAAAPPGQPHADVLVVGSGYGGAVAAARLAGARRSDDGEAITVVVLERGQEYLPGEFPATFAELPGHVRLGRQDGQAPRGRRNGLFDLRPGKTVSVLLGNGLGGGSLINAAVMEKAGPEAFEGGIWPPGVDRDGLADGYQAALDMLDVERVPGMPAKLASLLAAGAAMGAPERRKADLAVAFVDKPTPAGVPMSACLSCGDCVSGCNHQAKKSLDTNYLAHAKARGARLFCGATVRLVRAAANGQGYEVDFVFTDPALAGCERDQPYTLHARQVILAAGALGSTEILLRSRDAGLGVVAGAVLGSRFSANGDLIAVAQGQRQPARSAAPEGVPPEDREVGPTITGLVRQPVKGGRPLVFEEFAIPAPLYRLLGEVVTTCGALHGLLHPDLSYHREGERGEDPLAVSAEVLDHTPVYGMMGDDGAGGTLALQEGPADTDGQLAIQWARVGDQAVFALQIEQLRDAHERPGGTGGRVLPNPMWQLLPALPGQALQPLPGAVMTVHPLGGCPMAADKSRGVVDDCGRVYAQAGGPTATLPGLAVLDGSIVPVALGINPALTIAALAERALPQLAAKWGIETGVGPAQPLPPRPRRRDLTQPVAPASTRFTLHERMTGTLVADQRRFEATARVDFGASMVSDWRRLPREVPLDQVQLDLVEAASGARHGLRCSGSASVLVREHSDAPGRVMRTLDLARRRLTSWLEGDCGAGLDGLRALFALCTHLGQVRLICYHWTVEEAPPGAPLQQGQRLRLTKRIEFSETGNPWRQLSEGRLDLLGPGVIELGRLAVDLGFFAEQLLPLLQVESQQDAPNALGDLAELALWIGRVLLHVHLLDFLPPADGALKGDAMLPGPVDGIDPAPVPMRGGRGGGPRRQLVRYEPRQRRAGTRPVLLIHGYGASGSTFAHPSIESNLVATLLRAGRQVWVLDLRTSIGLQQRVYWPFDVVACEDIPDAIDALQAAGGGGRVDVVAHCIGAAMFSLAVLSVDGLHRQIGAVVLSQAGPLLRGSPLNRLRAYLASYLQQYLGTQVFDVGVDQGSSLQTLLADALLATFPYPEGDTEAERLQTLPGFAAARHRADAIFGHTMHLPNVADATLESLKSIYGWVTVQGLAQVGHYARQQVLTDALGQNRQVAWERLSERFGFPLLLLHGGLNGVFDWRGSYETIALLQRIFDGVEPPPPPAALQGDLVLGTGTPRQLHVLAAYGHQDSLIGQDAHRDVFPRIVRFLDAMAATAPAQPPLEHPPLVARWPWAGPNLGAVRHQDDHLLARVALRPPPAQASVLLAALIPARRVAAGWDLLRAGMVVLPVDVDGLSQQAIEVRLTAAALPAHQGFAVLTVHTELPIAADVARRAGLTMQAQVPGLFSLHTDVPDREVRAAIEALLAEADAAAVEHAVVRLDPNWIAAITPPDAPAAASLCFALGSCQYPSGLFDREPAQRSLRRLAQRLDPAAAEPRPQLLLLAGDQVYVDESAGLFDLAGADAVDRAYEGLQRLPAWRQLTRSLPTHPLLDDHEVADDWEPGQLDPADEARALQAYVDHQHKLVAPGTVGPFHHRPVAAGLPMIAFDTRSTRQRRTLRPHPQGQLLADATIADPTQLAALLAELAALPPEWPKFLLSSVALLPLPRAAAFGHAAERIGIDDWSGFPRSQMALLQAVVQTPLRNLVLLAGDRHHASVSSLWLEGPHGPVELISIVSSGLYAPWPFATTRDDSLQLGGAVVLQHDGITLTGEIVTPLFCASEGFALVQVERDAGGIWTLDVRLDQSDGVHRARRRLDAAGDRDWQVERPGS